MWARGWLLICVAVACDLGEKPDDTGPAGAADQDGDGSPASVDCDDGDGSIHPGADELCNGVDDDCDGVVDEEAVDAATWCDDDDGDGHGDPEACAVACEAPSGTLTASQADDCDDRDPGIHPSAEELCNGVDDDCDDEVDEEAADAVSLWLDQDGDGHGDPATTTTGCPDTEGWSSSDDDCDDDEPLAAPSLEETCNDGIDNDCDGGANDCKIQGDIDLGTSDVKIIGEEDWRFGYYTVGGGDLDGDGTPDLVIGYPQFHELLSNGGRVWVFSGADLSAGIHGPDAAVAVLDGASEKDYLGQGLAMVGDMDGDGDGELFTGAHGLGFREGWVALWSGPVTGSRDLDDADAMLLGSMGDYAGSSLAAPGDVNGDGVPDLLVGAMLSNIGGTLNGAAYLVLGPVTADGSLANTAETVFVGAGDFHQAGYQERGVAGAGDTNADGYQDLLIGVPHDKDRLDDPGEACIVLGPTTPGLTSLADADAVLTGEEDDGMAGKTVAGAGDTDADGYDDVLVSAPYCKDDNGRVYLVTGPISGAVSLAGATAIFDGIVDFLTIGNQAASAGDVDGDGHSDILVDFERDNALGDETGSAYLVQGPVTGVWELQDVANAHLTGEHEEAYAGSALGSMGDLQGDGYDDLFVGARYDDEGGRRAGAVYIVFGLGQ
jgi:hypothetical protein